MKGKSPGFSLIELMVVVVVLAAFLAVAAPGTFVTGDMSLRSASRGLVSTVRHLYSRAVFEKRVYKLSFDLDSGEYWAEVLSGSAFTAGDDPIHERRKLPSGVSFSDIRTERTLGKVSSGRGAFIVFLPTGFVDPAVIHLVEGEDNFYTLLTNPYTGATEVFDEYMEFEDGFRPPVGNPR